MDIYALIVIVVVFYVALLFFDILFKVTIQTNNNILLLSSMPAGLLNYSLINCFFQSCSHYPYLVFMQKTGLSVGPFQLRWYTTSLNRLILKMSFWHPRIQSDWFTFGSWITICLIVPSICVVIVSSAQLFKQIFTESTANGPSANQPDVFLEPIVSIFI